MFGYWCVVVGVSFIDVDIVVVVMDVIVVDWCVVTGCIVAVGVVIVVRIVVVFVGTVVIAVFCCIVGAAVVFVVVVCVITPVVGRIHTFDVRVYVDVVVVGGCDVDVSAVGVVVYYVDVGVTTLCVVSGYCITVIHHVRLFMLLPVLLIVQLLLFVVGCIVAVYAADIRSIYKHVDDDVVVVNAGIVVHIVAIICVYICFAVIVLVVVCCCGRCVVGCVDVVAVICVLLGCICG